MTRRPTSRLELGSLEKGFSVPDAGLVVFTDHDIFDRYRRRRRLKFRGGGSPVASFEALTEGDYVVHIAHGIGRYVGMTHVEADGRALDCVVVEYADGGKLYVPADELDRLQKYVGKDGVLPPLNKLGTAAWQKTTARAKAAVQELARDLLRHYAMRKGRAGHACGPDVVWQQELEASFIYEDTEDQLRATEEIKRDMESPRPMDRLVCGDVGFGKTEVAIRAAFKAVMGGKQVAVLVPTTILAQQHLTTFRDRLAEYPVVIDVLSRFRTDKEQDDVIGAPEGRQGRYRHRNAPARPEGRRVLGPRASRDRRGAAVRRAPQGDHPADAVVRGRPHSDGHADPAHPVHVAHGRARPLRDQHAARATGFRCARRSLRSTTSSSRKQ